VLCPHILFLKVGFNFVLSSTFISRYHRCLLPHIFRLKFCMHFHLPNNNLEVGPHNYFNIQRDKLGKYLFLGLFNNAVCQLGIALDEI
jgi:hypothetical protein